MEKLNGNNDLKTYLQSGVLTQPFLDAEYVKGRIDYDMSQKQSKGREISQLASLMGWIRSRVQYARGEKEFIAKNQFQRSAKEIWESGKTVGCTDYALLFAVFARQLGVPTTYLHTASIKWVKDFQENGEIDTCRGHSFCECFYNGEWILVDPTAGKVVGKYDVKKITTPYLIGGDNEFLPYYRGLDLGERQSIRQHNDKMKNIFKCTKANDYWSEK